MHRLDHDLHTHLDSESMLTAREKSQMSRRRVEPTILHHTE